MLYAKISGRAISETKPVAVQGPPLEVSHYLISVNGYEHACVSSLVDAHRAYWEASEGLRPFLSYQVVMTRDGQEGELLNLDNTQTANLMHPRPR